MNRAQLTAILESQLHVVEPSSYREGKEWMIVDTVFLTLAEANSWPAARQRHRRLRSGIQLGRSSR